MNPWDLYDELIEGIPEDVEVVDYGMGLHWSWLEAECGCGISYTTRGGATKGGRRDLRGKPLRKAAELAKSWHFEDATIGVAALNAWYSQRALIEELPGMEVQFGIGRAGRDEVDPFLALRPEIEVRGNARVVVVGHFPHVEDIAEYAQLTVLERNCRSGADTPDPACEYVIPGADYVFLTGVTVMNKTAPRLLQLAEGATTVMVGPSVIGAEPLLRRGVNALAGRVVLDPEKARFSCATGEAFGDALASYLARRR